MCDCFDALGCDLDIESLCHRDSGAHDALVAIVFIDVSDQRLVQHETVDEAVVQRLKGHIARAEMIQ